MLVQAFIAAGQPLRAEDRALPVPAPGEIRLRIAACGVCRTDLHLVDGELPAPAPHVVPGHEIVGYVDALGPGVDAFRCGDRVGVPWLGGSCGRCAYCLRCDENLCDAACYTGYTRDGGYADYCVADARFCLRLPLHYSDTAVAPLLCAGLIGYRALRMAGDARRIGLYGFGAAAHILAPLCALQGREVFAFVRPGDDAGLAFARRRGVAWAGYSDAPPPRALDAALIFAPDGHLVPTALQAVVKGGVVVCAGIHMSDIPAFPYALLWGERCLRSVAYLTRADGAAFFAAIAHHRIDTDVTVYPLSDANRALEDLRRGHYDGAAVLVPDVVVR